MIKLCKNSIRILIILLFFISCAKNNRVEFPIGLNSDMTVKEVENILKTKLVFNSNWNYSDTLKDTFSFKSYELKEKFQIDQLVFTNSTMQFDDLRNGKLNYIRFKESELAYFNPKQTAIELKSRLENKYLYLESEHKVIEGISVVPTAVYDSYIKNNLFLHVCISSNFSSWVAHRLITNKEKINYLDKERAYE